jgi:hypothetical protein
MREFPCTGRWWQLTFAMFGEEKSTTALREALMLVIGNFAFPSVERVNAKRGRQIQYKT